MRDPELLAIREEMALFLKEKLVPFWLDHGIDETYGGFLTCIDENGCLTDDSVKQIITQARMLWGFSYLQQHCREDDKNRMLDAAKQEKEFFLRCFWDRTNGGFVWKCNRQGEVLDDGKLAYAQSFAIYALSEYARVFHDSDALRYDICTDDLEAVRYQAREEIAMRKMLDAEDCAAFTNTFEDLHGMRQLPGLACQHLMASGYGYGGEGDWKVSAMTAVMKGMSAGMGGGTSFMEDYTYDLKNGIVLGAHMLEVCPSLAAGRPKIEVHTLGIGGKEAPARLVFEGKAGAAVVASLVDIGGRLRLIAQDIACMKPTQTMPNLPVARVMWKPTPSLAVGAECWILAGGAHHTVLSFDCDAEMLRDWARMMDIEFVHIYQNSDPVVLEQELFLADLAWKLKAW